MLICSEMGNIIVNVSIQNETFVGGLRKGMGCVTGFLIQVLAVDAQIIM
jgi:hypothetical protein